MHVSIYAEKAGLDRAQIASLTTGGPDDECWSDDDRLLIRLCDSLHSSSSVDDDLWTELAAVLSDEAIIELLMLAGFYRTVSYLVNGLRLPLEAGTARFADFASGNTNGLTQMGQAVLVLPRLDSNQQPSD